MAASAMTAITQTRRGGGNTADSLYERTAELLSLSRLSNISIGDLFTLMPFDNQVDVIEIRGKYLRQIFEHSVENNDVIDRPGAFLQVSGVKVVCRPKRQRVTSIQVMCRRSRYPAYSDLDDDELYRVATVGFLIKGGDGYKAIMEQKEGWHRMNFLDTEVFTTYLKTHQPIVHGTEGRITLLQSNCDTGSLASRTRVNLSVTALLLFFFCFLTFLVMCRIL